MKNYPILLSAGLFLGLAFCTPASFGAEKDEAPPAVGSIRLTGKVAKADRPALARLPVLGSIKS